MSAQIGARLSDLGHDVYYNLVTGCNDFILDKLAKKEFVPTPNTIYLWIRPPHYIKNPEFDKKNINVFFTMHEKESFEGWKSDWVELLNKCSAVITPTEWNKKVFIKNGLKVPCYVVPLGVDVKIFTGPTERKFGILTLHEALGSDNSRENWKDTLEAYFKAFYGEKDVYLTIKSWNVNKDGFMAFKESLIKENNWEKEKLPEIRVVDLSLPPSSLNELYAHHHLFVKNANREGFCLPLVEAFSCGVYCLVSDLSIFKEIWKKYERRYLDFFPLEDKEALQELMIGRFRIWKKWRGAADQFSWNKVVKKLEKVLEEVASAKT